NYDMNRHARVGQHTSALTDEVIDTFTIVGPVDHCIERLLALRALGVTKFCILAADWRDIDPKLQEFSRRTLADEVLPGVREGSVKYEQQTIAAGSAGDAGR